MIRIIIFCMALVAAPGCARRTGSLQVGSSQPAFQLQGDNLAINPEALGLGQSPDLTLDAYSDGTVDVRLGREEGSGQERGSAF